MTEAERVAEVLTQGKITQLHRGSKVTTYYPNGSVVVSDLSRPHKAATPEPEYWTTVEE